MLVAFDLEIATPIPTHCPQCDEVQILTAPNDERICLNCKFTGKTWEFIVDPWRYAPFGISCAAAAWWYEDEVNYRFWQSDPGRWAMSVNQVLDMLRDLMQIKALGGRLVTWNGANFDWRAIATESGHPEATSMMLNHIDPMFELFCRKGWQLGQDTACKGMRIRGKLKSVTLNDGTEFEGMSGMIAPQMWRDGERDAVLTYLQEDVRSLLELVEAIKRDREIRWISKSGRLNKVPIGLYTVQDSLKLDEPDTAWMGSGRKTRRDLIGWIGEKWPQ